MDKKNILVKDFPVRLWVELRSEAIFRNIKITDFLVFLLEKSLANENKKGEKK